VKGWLARPVLAMAVAVLGAAVLGVAEAVKVSRAASEVGIAALALGATAVLVPVASAMGIAVGASALLLDPRRRWGLRATLRGVAALHGPARARVAALALSVPGAAAMWLLACAHVARVTVAAHAPWVAGAETAVVSVAALVVAAGTVMASTGVETAVVSVAALVVAAGTVMASTGVTARIVTAEVSPYAAGACGATFAVCCVALGVRLGDASGNGPTPVAIFGVLARHELDLTPVFELAALAAFACIGERASRERRWGRVAVAAGVVTAGWGLVAYESRALSADPYAARALELEAPLGRVALGLARRVTDRDHDGASALFGGGDCDDRDPRRNPSATDVPGNGVDEDCSGADLPPPRPPPPPPPSPRGAFPHDLNLVLLTVDTLRIDLGFMGYPRPVTPSLDALAARSTVFERAYSMASYTGKSLGPTMIGRYPSECLRDGSHFDTYFPQNLFLAERLQAAGFHTMGVASHWYFKPRYGLAQGMDVWDLSPMPPESGGDADSSVTSEKLTDAAIGLLSDAANVDKRFFLWVHYFDPHADYVSHSDAPDFRAGSKGWAKPAYDGEVWYTDHHIGRLLDFIAGRAWGSKTAIVLTADHGEAFEEHGMSYHGVDLWEPLVRVPLVFYVPGAKPHRVPVKRSLIDLVPTVLDLMDLPQPPPGELSGESNALAIVAPDDVPVEERDVLMDMPAGPRVSLHRAFIHGRSPGMKLMAEGGPVFLLFNLDGDAAEADDLSRDRGELRKMMRAFDEKLSGLREIHVEPIP
jgi:arylsulfatase A-like enzyme